MKPPLRILSLEDDPNDAELIQAVLEGDDIDCQVTRVETRAAFLDALDAAPLDLILADYTLPSFDGLSALKIAQEKCPEIPFLFVSGTLGEEVAIEALKIGATDYVLKTRLSRLGPSVQRALREAEARRERRRAEAALRRSEAYLEEAQRISLTGSFGWQVSNGELYWSNETFRMFGYDPSVKPSLERVMERTHPDDRPVIEQLLKRLSGAARHFDIEHRVLLPDGSLKNLRVVGYPTVDREIGTPEIVGAVSDITERRQVEAALRESEGRFRTMADTLPEVIWIRALSPDQTLYASPSFERIWGLPVQQLFDRPSAWMNAIHPDDCDRIAGLYARWTSGEDVTYHDVEYRIVRPDGGVRWIHDSGVLGRDESGRPARVSGISADITERKRSEEELQRALAEIQTLKDQLYQENVLLREEIDKASMFEEIVGEAPALQSVLSRVSKVAPADSTVLITGETGTGKELIARAIHKRSRRSSRAFVSVNCAAVPQSLISSELFGHEKGAFTGATHRRIGRFELAEGGTLFLDEIGELPQETQIALLRVLQEHEFERVGGSRPIRTDVRVVAATNRDLPKAIAAGAFRSDLYYRLNVFPIEMPPLRDRREDIPLLVQYFIDRYATKAGKKIRSIHRATLDRLQRYSWPGNIRELQNVIERSTILCEGDNLMIDESWLSRHLSEPATVPIFKMTAAQERETIEAALSECRGRVSGPTGAAVKLGLHPSTLDSKIRVLKINKHAFKSD